MFSKLFIVFAISLGVLPASIVFAGDEMDVDKHKLYNPSTPDYEDIEKDLILDVNSSARYGVLGNIGRSVTGGGSFSANEFQLKDTEIDDLIEGDADAAKERTELLGCSAIDLHAGAITSLNNKEEHVKEYVDSPLGRYMLTTVLNSPAIASTFNTVEAFGGKRVQLMQDRCQAMQADATISAEGMMRWQALQACVAKNMDGHWNEVGLAGDAGAESVALAVAYRSCLYGHQGQGDTFATAEPVEALEATFTPSPSYSMQEALKEDVLKFDGDNPSLWTGTLFHALRNTAFCEMTGGEGVTPDVDVTDPARCALMALVPNVRWCAGSERFERKCLDDSKVRLSRAMFTPQQIFDLIFAFSEKELAYRDAFAAHLLKETNSPKISRDIATAGETLYNPMVDRTAEDTAIDQRMDEVRLFSGCIANGTLEDGEDFSEYIQRAMDVSSTDDIDSATAVYQGGPTYGTLKATLSGAVTPPAMLSALDDILDFGELDKRVSAVVSSGDVTATPALADRLHNPSTLGAIVVDATRCVMKHHLRLTLLDHLDLRELDTDVRVGALLAVRLNIAHTTTELLYRHLKEKLLLAQLDLQNGGSVSSRRATPPHVLASMDTLLKHPLMF